MRFRIKGNKEEIKSHIETFVEESRKEYDIQIKKARNIPLPFGVSNMPPFEIGLLEDGEDIILWNTAPMPSVVMKTFIGKRIINKMKKSLDGYFNALKVKAEVEYLGE
jgi:hypothetical protein